MGPISGLGRTGSEVIFILEGEAWRNWGSEPRGWDGWGSIILPPGVALQLLCRCWRRPRPGAARPGEEEGAQMFGYFCQEIPAHCYSRTGVLSTAVQTSRPPGSLGDPSERKGWCHSSHLTPPGTSSSKVAPSFLTQVWPSVCTRVGTTHCRLTSVRGAKTWLFFLETCFIFFSPPFF